MRLKSGCSYCATNFSHASPSVHSWKLFTPSMANRFGNPARMPLVPAIRLWREYGPRRLLVPLDHDRAAERGLDDRRADVAGDELLLVPLVVGREVRLRVERPDPRRRRERHDVAEGVLGAREAHVLGHRAEAVARIEVPVAPDVVVRAPRAGAAVHLLHLVAQVVDVRRLAVEQLADDALADHVEVDQLLPPVAHVLHVHAVAAGLLGGVHELPHLVHRHGDGRLDEHVGAGLHGRHAHRRRAPPTGWRRPPCPASPR